MNMVNTDTQYISAILQSAKRIVVKVGTNVLMEKDDEHNIVPNMALMSSLATQIRDLHTREKEIVLVSSGAIGFGASEIQVTPPIQEIPLRQACAAIGQPLLMAAYRKVFGEHNIHCAQILLTRHEFDSLASYRAVQDCIHTLLRKKIIPIVNENDSVAIDEIRSAFGDNDQLSAMLASKLNADMLVLLTDVDALYTRNPKKYTDAERIPIVDNVEPFLLNSDHSSGSNVGTGGIVTKLKAALITRQAGCIMVIGHAKAKNILLDITKGHNPGTVFRPLPI